MSCCAWRNVEQAGAHTLPAGRLQTDESAQQQPQLNTIDTQTIKWSGVLLDTSMYTLSHSNHHDQLHQTQDACEQQGGTCRTSIATIAGTSLVDRRLERRQRGAQQRAAATPDAANLDADRASPRGPSPPALARASPSHPPSPNNGKPNSWWLVCFANRSCGCFVPTSGR